MKSNINNIIPFINKTNNRIASQHMHYKTIFNLFLLSIVISSCATMPVKGDFTATTTPPPPDYAQTAYWSALPDKKDSADHIPANSTILLTDGQQSAEVDVFYIYPTHFFSRKEWNADVNDEKLNRVVDTRSVYHQASVFNGSCKVYIPRYRQAAFNAYFSLDNPDALKAFELAYEDVKTAFQYYLDHYNNGRPIIIASHSQGTTHAKWLLRDFFDGKPLQQQLVCAYLIGMPVYTYDFTNISPCKYAGETGCFVSWRSYLEGAEPKAKMQIPDSDKVVVHNPITFTSESGIAKANLNSGGLGRDGETIYPSVCAAQIHGDIVWVSKPDIPGKLFVPKNLHPADYNLYWIGIRENVALRISNYQKE